METSPRKPGRPTTAGTPGEKSTLGIRTTAELKARLQAAAESSGRSLSQEAEHRLERSFDRQDVGEEVLVARFGPELFALLLIMGRGMQLTGTTGVILSTGQLESVTAWISDPYAYRKAAEAAKIALDAFTPPGEVVEPPEAHIGQLSTKMLQENLAAGVMAPILEAIAYPDRARTRDLADFAAKVRPLLGPLAEVQS